MLMVAETLIDDEFERLDSVHNTVNRQIDVQRLPSICFLFMRTTDKSTHPGWWFSTATRSCYLHLASWPANDLEENSPQETKGVITQETKGVSSESDQYETPANDNTEEIETD